MQDDLATRLVDAGIATEEQVKGALQIKEQRGCSFRDALIASGIPALAIDAVLRAEARLSDFPLGDVDQENSAPIALVRPKGPLDETDPDPDTAPILLTQPTWDKPPK
ncbi:MAG: hypothetical protein KC416_16630 [Myxococcales bacterium]|nr:hypothetical protein [Myxococcales bacterium]